MDRKTTSTLRNVMADRRWKLLKTAFLQRKNTDNINQVSVRRFATFGLVSTSEIENSLTENSATWYAYSFKDQDLVMDICHCNGTVNDVLSFNNTGNVCVWPAEEVLAAHCLVNKDSVKGMNVCELGGGMTCLAGVALACTGVPNHVLLTDGNEKCVDNVAKIIKQNKLKDVAECRALRWDVEYPDLRGRYDLVICADCLFFDEYRTNLVETLDALLNSEGEAWIFAPTRGHTLTHFVHLAGEKFVTQVSYYYDSRMSNIRRRMLLHGPDVFDENLHYPLFVKLTRMQWAIVDT